MRDLGIPTTLAYTDTGLAAASSALRIATGAQIYLSLTMLRDQGRSIQHSAGPGRWCRKRSNPFAVKLRGWGYAARVLLKSCVGYFRQAIREDEVAARSLGTKNSLERA